MSYLINDNEYEKILSYYKDNLKSEEEYWKYVENIKALQLTGSENELLLNLFDSHWWISVPNLALWISTIIINNIYKHKDLWEVNHDDICLGIKTIFNDFYS
jgi:hypothetical protein